MNLTSVFENSINTIYGESVAVEQMSQYYENKAKRYSNFVTKLISERVSNKVLPLGDVLIRSEDFYDAVNDKVEGINFKTSFVWDKDPHSIVFMMDVWNQQGTDEYGLTKLDRLFINLVNFTGNKALSTLDAANIMSQHTSFTEEEINDMMFKSDTGQAVLLEPFYLLMYQYCSSYGVAINWDYLRDGTVDIYSYIQDWMIEQDRYSRLIPVTGKQSLFFLEIDYVMDAISAQNALSNLTSDFIHSLNINDGFSYIQGKIGGYLGNSNPLSVVLQNLNMKIQSVKNSSTLDKIKAWIHAFSSEDVATNQDGFCNVDTQAYSGVSLSQIVMADVYSICNEITEKFKQINFSNLAQSLVSAGAAVAKGYVKFIKWEFNIIKKGWNWCKSKFDKVVAQVSSPIDIAVNSKFEDSSFDEGYYPHQINDFSQNYPSLYNKLIETKDSFLCFPIPGASIYIGYYDEETDAAVCIVKFQLIAKEAAKKILSSFGSSESAVEAALTLVNDYGTIDKVETSAEEVRAYQSLIYSKMVAALFITYISKGYEYIHDKMNNDPNWYLNIFKAINVSSLSPASVEAISSVTNSQFIAEIVYYDDTVVDFDALINHFDYYVGNADEYIPYFVTSGQMLAKYHILTDENNINNAIHTLVVIGTAIIAVAVAIIGIRLAVKLKHSAQEARWSADMIAFGEDPSKLNMKNIRKANRKANFLEKLAGTNAEVTAAGAGLASSIASAVRGGDEDQSVDYTIEEIWHLIRG